MPRDTLFEIERKGETIIFTPVVNLGVLENVEAIAGNVVEVLNDLSIKNLVIDFCKTNYFGTSPIALFVKLRKIVIGRNGSMVYCNLSDKEQWKAVMGNTPSPLKGKMNLPVETVSWDDCQEHQKVAGKGQKAVSPAYRSRVGVRLSCRDDNTVLLRGNYFDQTGHLWQVQERLLATSNDAGVIGDNHPCTSATIRNPARMVAP